MQAADAACAATAAEQKVTLQLLSTGHLVAVLTDARQRDWATLSDQTQNPYYPVQIVGLANLAACQPSAASAAVVDDAHAELEAARLQTAQLQAQMQVLVEAPCWLSNALRSLTPSAAAVHVLVQLRQDDHRTYD